MTWNSFSTELQKRKNNSIHIKESGTSVLGFFLVLSFQNIFLKVFQGFILFFCFKKSSQRAYFGGRYHIFGVADSFFRVKNYSDEVSDSVFEVLNPADGVLDSSVGVINPTAEVSDPIFEVNNPNDEVLDPKFEVRNPKNEVNNPKIRLRNLIGGVWDAKFPVQNTIEPLLQS